VMLIPGTPLPLHLTRIQFFRTLLRQRRTLDRVENLHLKLIQSSRRSR